MKIWKKFLKTEKKNFFKFLNFSNFIKLEIYFEKREKKFLKNCFFIQIFFESLKFKFPPKTHLNPSASTLIELRFTSGMPIFLLIGVNVVEPWLTRFRPGDVFFTDNGLSFAAGASSLEDVDAPESSANVVPDSGDGELDFRSGQMYSREARGVRRRAGKLEFQNVFFLLFVIFHNF